MGSFQLNHTSFQILGLKRLSSLFAKREDEKVETENKAKEKGEPTSSTWFDGALRACYRLVTNLGDT